MSQLTQRTTLGWLLASCVVACSSQSAAGTESSTTQAPAAATPGAGTATSAPAGRAAVAPAAIGGSSASGAQAGSSAPAVSSTASGGATAGALAMPAASGGAGAAAATAGTSAADGGASGATASAGAGATPVDEVSAGCAAAAAFKPGDSTRQVQSNDRMRRYLMHVPSKYSGKDKVPLVFDFHGYSSNPQAQLGGSGFRELADQEGFIVLYPEGVGASWHVNGCCGQAGDMKLDEIAFVRAIMDDVGKQTCIDLKRVYASGISQGGGMAHHVGCLAADIFAGVAPVSSDLRTEPCMPARPVTEISFRGLADSLDAYEGGHVGPPGMDGYTAIGAKPTLEKWKTINMCSGTLEKMDDLCETYATCAGGSAVSLCSIPGADHVLYKNAQGLSVPKVSWELFKKHPR